MRYFLLIFIISLFIITPVHAQEVISVCIQVPNPFGGAPSCVPISSTNPLPAQGY